MNSSVQEEGGAIISQLGTPDMKLPIQYALYYPSRRTLSGERLDFYKLSQITFEEPDLHTFSGLKLAFQAMRCGGNIPTVFNAANEKAVAMFLDRKIGFLQIPEIIGTAMEEIPFAPNPSVSDILDAEKTVYELIESRW